MFKNDIPNYKVYSNDTFYMTVPPDNREFWEEIEAYATRSENLAHTVNRLNKLALIPPTSNWGHDWLIADLSEVMSKIRKKARQGDIPLLMDAIAAIAHDIKIDITEMNEFLLRHEIGYQLDFDRFKHAYYWSVRDNIESLIERIDNTIKDAEKSDLQQAVEHLEQAKRQLENVSSNERARKNAVRDCASAMEAIIKNLGEDDDIKQASKKLRDSHQWGLDDIVKDGDAIFNKLHHLYPDFRHGSTETSSMTLNEAKYWIDRITVYIDYMLRQKDEQGL